MGDAKKHKNRQADAQGRILRTAARLFRNQGYSTTGINQIIAESQASKASFYYYYPSKEDLGREYLATYGADQLRFFHGLMRRHARPGDFARAWMNFLKRLVRADNFYGCPMANFRAQLGDTPARLESDVANLARRVIGSLTEYLTAAREQGFVAAQLDPAVAARRLFAAYEGSVQVWKLTGDEAALEDFIVLAESIWG